MQAHRAGLSSPFLSRDFPADPYPGARPGVGYVEIDGACWALTPERATGNRWAVHTGRRMPVDLDSWLAAQGAATTRDRLPVLAYGSNACPSKITWIRDNLELTGPVIVLMGEITGASAVWSAGKRERDGQRPAVLAAARPGTTERHAIWLATPAQRAVLDKVEGRGQRYRLAWVHAPVSLDNGETLEWVLAYVARPDLLGQARNQHLSRSPLLIDGEMVRVRDVSQEHIRQATGTIAASDSLTIIEVSDEPSWLDIEAEDPR
ncbi:hypothetical protein EV191_1011435 [Tamaricihabitans halophyticus]|uniref:Uncharacterized protein n=1 Tax=Tamaricihabitans halophyticus TaxID=1262583 RepID=A0A4R2R6K1_9PSEU|nr:gamma-glutamylcyclotransferase [Tamaricihabitans halophyticus]TCP57478.1 hypothetical protein EV191_1011435 [Tamaricihabitans halophyticus]